MQWSKHGLNGYIERNREAIMLTLAVILLGAILGSFCTLSLPAENVEGIRGYLDELAQNDTLKSMNFGSLVFKTFLVTELFILIIWASPFFRYGFLAAFFSVFLRSFIMGFATSFYVFSYGLKGLLISFTFLLFENFVLILILVCMMVQSATLRKTLKNLKYNKYIAGQYRRGHLMMLILHNLIIIIYSALDVYTIKFIFQIIKNFTS